ncbi:glucuronate isomerase [Sporomusa sp.]|uniref:glucuronate isomerase n=1 Tax=Sporomusa sp. TaxID=2078658 RepID=UPI002C94FE58|nr:glucuronate isomerase [Sporomusa sp.]HWR08678.1 glucuronate isomerase [Sporomusa sp.]
MFDEELLLTNETGKKLYHKYAENMPIIDYHCHLQPQEIYENQEFQDLGEMWLSGDHYKWRAMRTFGIDEKYITGDSSYYEKYLKFSGILPYLIGNPIYIWCALELKRFFDIDEPLGPDNAEAIYQKTKKMIQEKHMTPQWCMTVSNVELVSTTEDPTDSLQYHLKIKQDPAINIKVISAFRPDKAFYCEKPVFPAYISTLEKAAATKIDTFAKLMSALEKRLIYFKELGTMISDCGIEDICFYDYQQSDIEVIFSKAVAGVPLTEKEKNQYKAAFVVEMGKLYYKHNFIMQLHIGTYQGANKSRENSIGVACGFDCTDDSTSIQSVGEILNRLTTAEQLPKTILYPLDASKVENFAVLAAGFCEGGTKAKVQLGAPWWFNDQVYGIQRQFEAVANLYPVSLSVGMLTDSRSFLSYPRHEMYRRVLCNYFGALIERGEYFSEEKYLKKMIENICYYNAKEFFGL